MTSPVLNTLLAINTLLRLDMERTFAGTTLTETKVHALWFIQLQGPCTQQSLASELAVTPRSVSAMTDGLEATGYLVRSPHPDDRRAVLLHLTPAAKTMMQRMERDHTSLNLDLIDAVAIADREALSRGITAILSYLGEQMTQPGVRYTEVENATAAGFRKTDTLEASSTEATP